MLARVWLASRKIEPEFLLRALMSVEGLDQLHKPRSVQSWVFNSGCDLSLNTRIASCSVSVKLVLGRVSTNLHLDMLLGSVLGGPGADIASIDLHRLQKSTPKLSKMRPEIDTIIKRKDVREIT